MDPKNVKRVAVIGAGVMGHSIAQVFAQAGILVHLVDLKNDLLVHALKLVKSNLQTLADCGRVSPQKPSFDSLSLVKRYILTSRSPYSTGR